MQLGDSITLVPLSSLDLLPFHKNSKIVVSETKIVIGEVDMMKEIEYPIIIGNNKLFKIAFEIETVKTPEYQFWCKTPKFEIPSGFGGTVMVSLIIYSQINTTVVDFPLHYKHLGARKSKSLTFEIKTSPSNIIKVDENSFQPIGRGSNGIVYKSLWNGLDVAIKTQCCSFKGTSEMEKEIDIIRNVRSEYCVHFYGCCLLQTGDVGFVYEYISNGNFSSIITESYDFNIRVLQDVSKGLLYLHSHHIIHRDLKPDNVLIASTNINDSIVGKITDFGTSKSFSAPEKRQLVGTPVFIAPEVFENKIYEYACDIYSFGMMLYQACSLKSMIFEDIKLPWELVSFICEGNRPERNETIKQKHWEIIESCWKQKYEERISVNKLVIDLIFGDSKDENVLLDVIMNSVSVKNCATKLSRQNERQPLIKKVVKKYSLGECRNEEVNSTILSLFQKLGSIPFVTSISSMLWCIKNGVESVKALLIDVLFELNFIDEAISLIELPTNNKCCKLLLATEYINGQYLKKDLDKGMEIMNDLSNQNFVEAQVLLGKYYLMGLVKNKKATDAYELFNKAFDNNCEEAEAEVGWCLYRGVGVEKNKKEAKAHFELSATKDISRGLTGLGAINFNSSSTLSRGFFERAIEDPDSYCWMGLLEQDNAKKFKLFGIASKKGSASGCYNLGVCYDFGVGTSVDYGVSLYWKIMAVQRGFIKGFYGLVWTFEMYNKTKEACLFRSREKNDSYSKLVGGSFKNFNNGESFVEALVQSLSQNKENEQVVAFLKSEKLKTKFENRLKLCWQLKTNQMFFKPHGVIHPPLDLSSLISK